MRRQRRTSIAVVRMPTSLWNSHASAINSSPRFPVLDADIIGLNELENTTGR